MGSKNSTQHTHMAQEMVNAKKKSVGRQIKKKILIWSEYKKLQVPLVSSMAIYIIFVLQKC